jgi:signal transduction histidine kinase
LAFWAAIPVRLVVLSATFVLWAGLVMGQEAARTEQPSPPSVLILNQSNSYRPWPNQIINEIRTILVNRAGGSIPVYAEDLDLYRFNGPSYLDVTEKYLQEKYRSKALRAIISVGSAGLDYTLRIRNSLWPDVPVVFAAVDRKTADLGTVSGVTGITIQLNLVDMIRAARTLLPDTKHFVLVGDRLERQLYYSQFAEELAGYSRTLDFIDLMGLPLSVVKQRLATLPEQSAILYIGINSDQTTVYVSADLVPVLAEVANRPIFVGVETYFGTGAVGGFIMSPKLVGHEAGQLALRVLAGADPSTLPVTTSKSQRPLFDWRQLRRWDISESNLPPGSDVRFRPPGAWELYRWQILAAFGVLLFQSALLGRLIIERHHRHSAEEESHRRIMQVIHLNRTATAGALSASVAHELNQPLGAILNYAETAELLLSEDSLNVPQLREIIADIRRDDQRASEVIKHLRGLLKQRGEQELQTFNLNDVITAAIRILEPEAVKRGVALDTVQATTAFLVHADQVQLQQVVLNLAFNAMDAIATAIPDRRRLMIQVMAAGKDDVEVVVSDSGPGIPVQALERVFEAFYTTKASGTGLGLSIARTIVETYGGRIWAENREGGGAVIRFTIPLAVEHAV